ncbi:DUF1793-domain-containing protein [Exidia glandulosa HHB12029]|uniref:DUF1793-domain-containing protein n=1 Tax=Exidia glandulosa HHB12029 TaxID=1314781 RepID=A0A165LR84_EXIGL|nr:DUF1793-domain-containing protein [Exidia glandulosa HHB12029]
MKLLSVLLAALTVTNSLAAWTSTPFSPASVPLAVRSPYINAWLAQGAGTALNDNWATFWTGSIVGWAGYVRVDGKVFLTMGAPSVPGVTAPTKATQTDMTFTATSSKFTLTAGPVRIVYTFLSPVTPSDLLRQSIPFAYMSVTAVSLDGASHSVQLYTDISAEWASGDNSLLVNWSTSLGSILTHQVQLQTQSQFTEVNDHIQQGSVFYSVNNGTDITYQTGQDTVLRAQFINNGRLANTQDTAFRAVSDRWPVFAFAKDFGTVGTTATAPVVFSVGHIRDPAAQYVTKGNVLQSRSSFFFSQLSTPAAVINFFLNDFANATGTAAAFDSKVNSDSAKIASNYAGLVSLSIRQAFAACELTLSKTSSGAFNTSDVLLFMKEISSDGNMNTVDVIFPAWPVLLYTNPQLGKFLLDGLFQYQATGLYPNKWSVHDLGSHYPKALGHNDGGDEAMPVEESGNMVIMALSYAQKTGDLSQLRTYFGLLDQWTQFLITDSLIPANQISTDDFAGPLANQTNLAIKGIVGIRHVSFIAMAEIARLTGDTTRANNYTSIATSYVQQWQTQAIASGGQHLTLNYGNSASWGLAYNLFGDKLLKLNLFPQSIYDMQTAWYKTKINSFGLPLDTRHTYTKSDWEIWTAGIVDTTLRNQIITAVVKYASDGMSSQPLGDWYETSNGAVEGFRARPVVGGHLALLIL